MPLMALLASAWALVSLAKATCSLWFGVPAYVGPVTVRAASASAARAGGATATGFRNRTRMFMALLL